MNKRIYLILSLLWLLPLATLADGVVKGTVTLNGQTIEAEYYLQGSTARLGSGYNACIPQYSIGKVEVPYYIIVGGYAYPVTEISTFAFYRCTRITEVTLSEGVMRIGNFAFAGCPTLQKVTLPSTLAFIGSGAFIDLPALQRIYLYATTPPTWEYNDVFCFHTDGIGDTQAYHTDQVTLYVPACGYRLYRTTTFTNPELGWTTPDGWPYFNHLELLFTPGDNYDNICLENGDWNDPSNWHTGVVPQGPTNNVLIAADVVIPEGYRAEVNEITICSGSITIKDGGQLVHNNAGVMAIMEKEIVGFTQNPGRTCLLTNPVIDEQDPAALGMTNGDYDLYYFDQSEAPEWIDYQQDTFSLINGKGYLYAKDTDAKFAFYGELNPANTDLTMDLAYDAEAEYAGFNLVGNPYSCNAYLSEYRDFYTLNEDGDEVVIATDYVIAPMQAILLKALEEEQLTFTTTEPTYDQHALTISLTRDSVNLCDNARIRLGAGIGLEKFQLNDNHDKLYFPMEDKEFAMAYADTLGVMPMNFKAENEGVYSLYFDTDSLTFEYLHLIDNFTEDDVDLLETPSYTFNVEATDDEDRFLIVFDPSAMDDPTENVAEYVEGAGAFAFISNDEICLKDTCHGATLQVIDMMGRIIVSTDVARNISTSGMTAGVYVLRLINGNDVKVQKLVVE